MIIVTIKLSFMKTLMEKDFRIIQGFSGRVAPEDLKQVNQLLKKKIKTSDFDTIIMI
jgi:glutathione peroxidase-family protein